MKNTFAVSMTLLLAFALGGSWLAYSKATHHEAEPHAAASDPATPSTSEVVAANPAATLPMASNAVTPTEGAPRPSNPAAQPVPEAEGQPAVAGDAQAGKAEFEKTCLACHGAEAQGGAVGPTLVPVADWTLAQFTEAVRNGQAPHGPLKPVMPRLNEAALSEKGLNDVYAYLKSLK